MLYTKIKHVLSLKEELQTYKALSFLASQPEPPKKPSNWRRKHEEFIATIRAAKGLNLKDGGKLPPPPPPSYDPGM